MKFHNSLLLMDNPCFFSDYYYNFSFSLLFRSYASRLQMETALLIMVTSVAIRSNLRTNPSASAKKASYTGAKKYWHPYLITTIEIRSL